jgi:hypothetical protein
VASQVAGVRVVLVDSQQAQLERALQTMGAHACVGGRAC